MSGVPEIFSSNPSDTPSPFSLTQITYTCPVCGETIITIEADTITYLKSHISESKDEEHKVTIKAYHPGRGSSPLAGEKVREG